MSRLDIFFWAPSIRWFRYHSRAGIMDKRLEYHAACCNGCMLAAQLFAGYTNSLTDEGNSAYTGGNICLCISLGLCILSAMKVALT